ncbi:MAG: GNAT family N-acetyltransferase [Chloroflexi bacterium]|jgi:ribosomal protein S18 acetylase RimI-like enzyme|nr:GNAT family N-acetyltransferase [Chloroflexota bacterium]
MPAFQTFTQQDTSITNATHADQRAISHFLSNCSRIHHHLDWLSTSEWIGKQPFLLEKHQQQIEAILLATPEVPEVAWIRLFGIRDLELLKPTWEQMLHKAITILNPLRAKTLAALGTNEVFSSLLIGSGFRHTNDVVILENNNPAELPVYTSAQIEIRQMCVNDLPEVTHLDQSTFAPIWQNSLDSLKKAYQLKEVATVAVNQQQIVGYQISTVFSKHSHLARLAVHPDHQGQKIASLLVNDLFMRLTEKHICQATVNTQADNHPSLAVYFKFGFQKTGKVIPVYQYDL